MSLLKVPENLPQLVTAAFARARANKDLNFFQTHVAVLRTGSCDMQLRYAPSLANKPKAAKPAAGSAPFDPFASPPAGLYITALSPEHYLVLNKFAIALEHFILATTQWQSQEDVLAAADLHAAHACIQAYRGLAGGNISPAEAQAARSDTARTGLLMFFNGGPASGASQPHRHLQMLPVSSLYEGLPCDSHWQLLCDAPNGQSPYGFGVFAAPMAGVGEAQDIWNLYIGLYRRACAAVLGDAVHVPPEGRALISYNLVMTAQTMVLCPRVVEGAEIPVGGGMGRVQFNGTVLAGTALVKNESEWDALRGDPEILKSALGKIGVPKEHGAWHKL